VVTLLQSRGALSL